MTDPTTQVPVDPTQAVRLRNVAVAMTAQGRHAWATDVLIAADALATVAADRDQARQQLADAPHDIALCLVAMGEAAPCTCWKAGL